MSDPKHNTDIPSPIAPMLDMAPIEDPGYLQYWEMRAENIEDVRLARIVNGLTQVAIRGIGEPGDVEYTDREPALQARYWYRALGPLNPMTGAEPDLAKACNLMYGKTLEDSNETASLQLDAAYALTDLARFASTPEHSAGALSLAIKAVRDIKHDDRFDSREASYRLQTHILQGDLNHLALRFRHTGSTRPQELGIDDYRQYEKDFVREELRGISEFGKLVAGGITEENFGVLFEWYFVLARRGRAWSDEKIDTTMVRGATSRENAEWTGEYDVDPNRVTGNHDVVVTENTNGADRTTRFQLKAVKGNHRLYHPSITVIDFQELVGQRFGSIDGATRELGRNLAKVRHEYVGSYAN